MRRTLFHLWDRLPSYIKNSSKTSPLLADPGRVGRLALVQKLCDFSTLRGGESATEAGAFQGCGGGGEPQGLTKILFFGDSQSKRAVEHVACAQRIHGMHRKGRGLLHGLMLVEPDRALRAARSRQK